MINKINTIAMLLSAVLVSTAPGTSSAADDGKLYPGSYCHSQSAQTLIDASNGDPTTIQNTSLVGPVFFTCPIIRDYFAADAGIKDVRIRYANNNPGELVRCFVDIRHRDGTFVARKSVSTQYGNRQGVLTIQVNQEAGVNRHYFLGCELPASVSNTDFPRIDSYRVVEFN